MIFHSQAGVSFKDRPLPSIDFAKAVFFSFVKEKGIKIAEIIPDYRQPRPGDRGDLCHPGEWGYQSIIPNDCKDENVWMKCMNSPIWIRENIGDSGKPAGLPYQDPNKFNAWLERVAGKPEDTKVVLIGLTIDCCVLCTGQELNWRGYDVRILVDGVDTASGNQ